MRLFYDVWLGCQEQGERVVPASQFSPVADQMIQLILLWPSENLRTPVRMQATTLHGPVLNCNHLFFYAQKAFVRFCWQKRFAATWTSLLLGIPFRGEVNDPNVYSQQSGKDEISIHLASMLLFPKRGNKSFHFHETLYSRASKPESSPGFSNPVFGPWT